MKAEILKKYNIDAAARTCCVQHSDFMKLDAKPKITKNDAGFLCGSSPVAKVGVMKYLMSDGSVLREFVPPETLFNADSMATLRMVPMTNNHPPEKRVTVSNASYRQIGLTGENVARVDDRLEVSMVITDAEAIEAIEAGRQELSPGYEAEIMFQPGKTDSGEEFDAVQVRRRYNHVAIVDAARGGHEIRLQMDGAETAAFKNEKNLNQEKPVIKVKIDGIEYDAAPEVVNRLNKLEGEVKTANDSAKAETEKAQALAGERDGLKAKVDALEKRDIAKEIQDGVAKRRDLERNAEMVLENVDHKLGDRALKIEVIKARLPEMAKKLDDKTSEAYIDAVLDTVISGLETGSLSAQRKAMGAQTANDGNADDEKTAREKMIKADASAYLPKTK